MAEAGLPSMVPPPPDPAGASDWTGWYQLFCAWVTEQQAWSARLYRVLLEEVAAGALRPEDVQASAREYLQRRLPDYLADMAELNAELVSDILAVADGSVDALSDVLVGRPDPGRSDPGPPDPEEMTIDVRGPAGSTASAALLIENSRREPAGVECVVTPAEGFGLVTAPMEFRLGAGESRAVAVRVALPAEPSSEPRAAGSVIIRGQGDRDLVVRVSALVE